MVTLDRFKELLTYDPLTGLFHWIVKRNGVIKNKPAGSIVKGYIHIMIDSKAYKAHRLAWFYMTGEWPIDQIDHINTIKTDNRFENLRQADNSKNKYNTPIYNNNTSGYKGVHFNKRIGLFAARIGVNKTKIHLGYFDSAEKAYQAYLQAANNIQKEFKHFSI